MQRASCIRIYIRTENKSPTLWYQKENSLRIVSSQIEKISSLFERTDRKLLKHLKLTKFRLLLGDVPKKYSNLVESFIIEKISSFFERTARMPLKVSKLTKFRFFLKNCIKSTQN